MRDEPRSNLLDRQIAAARERMATLAQGVGASEGQAETLEQLSIALEELNVAAEELHQQNEQLAAAQQVLQAESQHYRALFEYARDGYLVTDLDGVVLEANRAAAILLGVRPNMLVGKPLVVYVAEAEHRAFRTRLAAAIAGSSRDWRTTLTPRGGAPFPAGIVTGLAQDIGGAPTRIRWMLRDISDRVRDEQEIARLATFPQLNPCPVIEADMAGHVCYLNPAAESLFPDLRTAGSQHPLLAGLEATVEALHRDDKTLATREVRVGASWYQQAIHHVAAEERLRIYSVDITERRRAEHDLNHAQAVAHTGSWRLDIRQDELLWSDESYRIFAIPKGTPLTYEAFLAAVHPEDREYVDRKWQAGLRGEPYDIEHRIVVGDVVKWVREQAELEFNEEGTLLGGFGTCQDITERKRLEEELRQHRDRLEQTVAERTAALHASEAEVLQLNAGLERRVAERTAQFEAANKEMEAFSYSVSHDLRAPLRAVNGFANILTQEYGPQLPAEVQHYLKTINQNALQMGLLIDGLLTLSRLGRQSLDRREISPASLASQALEGLGNQQEGRNVQVTVGDLPPCQGDVLLLRQVYVHLLSNAFKFTQGRDPVRIEVGFRRLDGEGAYYVRDNGVGFDMRYAQKLYGVFQRLHRAEEFDGVGVGLAIVKRIIQRHGGRVWAEGELDKGATFYFTVP